MNEMVIIKKCRSCGAQYQMIRNPDWEKKKYSMKFINTDGKNQYYSNKSHYRCPSCMVSGKKQTLNETHSKR